MSEQDAQKAVIEPMLKLFPAPKHLRVDEDILEEAVSLYRRSLARFEKPVLELAWQRVAERNELWCWPKLADLLSAAEQAQRHLCPAGASESWVEEATKLSDAYVRKFLKSSQQAVRAREADYEPALKRYVAEASWVQAQAILGRTDFAYQAGVLFPWPVRDKEAEEEFFDQARTRVESGTIRVQIPRSLVSLWKEQAQSAGRDR